MKEPKVHVGANLWKPEPPHDLRSAVREIVNLVDKEVRIKDDVVLNVTPEMMYKIICLEKYL